MYIGTPYTVYHIDRVTLVVSTTLSVFAVNKNPESVIDFADHEQFIDNINWRSGSRAFITDGKVWSRCE